VDPRHPSVRFSGSGGACDIACPAKRTIIIGKHDKRRFPENVDYVTSPGWLDGGSSRRASGLIRGGPDVIVTTMGVIRFRPETRLPYLARFHPGFTPQGVAEETEFVLDIGQASATAPPSAEELRILRDVVDPERVFLR